jgi:hypothetical protein
MGQILFGKVMTVDTNISKGAVTQNGLLDKFALNQVFFGFGYAA